MQLRIRYEFSLSRNTGAIFLISYNLQLVDYFKTKVEKNKIEDIKTITDEIGDQYFTSSSQ